MGSRLLAHARRQHAGATALRSLRRGGRLCAVLTPSRLNKASIGSKLGELGHISLWPKTKRENALVAAEMRGSVDSIERCDHVAG
jgi:hypothetical protein